MAHTQVLYTDQLDRTLDKLAHGGLLLASTRSDGRSNVMTIGWATVGVVWGLPMLVAMIRPSRYTYEFVEESRVFTVNVPAPEMSDYVTLCGTRSGREVDKLAQVVTSAAQTINGVTIDGCPLVYECKVVHWDDLTPDHLLPDVRQRSYPRGDFHRLYYGQILGVFAG